MRRHLRLVEEDAAEVVAVGEDLVLQGQEGTARVDQVEAREVVLRGHLLSSQVLLDRERKVRAALDGRVVGDDDAFAALDYSDPGDDAGRGCLTVVEIPGGERIQLEERGAGVDQPIDAFPSGELPARPVPLRRRRSSAAGDLRGAVAQLGDEAFHASAPATELFGLAFHLRGEDGHRFEPTAGAAGAGRSRV